LVARLLVLEDDAQTGEALSAALAAEGFSVDLVTHIADAEHAIALGGYDLLLLDRRLPDGDSLSLIRGLRAKAARTPILILSARDTVDERVAGLSVGADDYLVKPFALAELRARVRALLRRPPQIEPERVVFGPVALLPETREVEIDGQPVPMRRQDVALLEALLRGAGRVVPRERLEHALFSLSDPTTPNALEQAVSRLRRQIATLVPDLAIEAVRGVGYVLRRRPA
jgi:DNA-binding response OmpR family regulator